MIQQSIFLHAFHFWFFIYKQTNELRTVSDFTLFTLFILQHELCLLVHKSLLGHMPEYISDILTSVANIPDLSTLRTSSCGNLVVQRTRRWIGDRAFSVAAPWAWNRLPTKLKMLRSTDSFRRDLKTFLFYSVYGHQDMDW